MLGAVAFLAAHGIEAVAWFISALPSTLTTAAAMVVAGIIAGARSGGGLFQAQLALLALVAGAVVPMTITLFTHPNGPGTLFPIALAVGTAVLIASAAAGLLMGWALGRTVR
jgi:hypothetical protein